MKKLLIHLAVVLIAGVGVGTASSLRTPEVTAISALSAIIEVHAKHHDGQLPKSWNDLRGAVDLSELNQSLVGWSGYPIEDHYAFINQPLSSPNASGSQVVLIRTVPLERVDAQDRTKSEQWRYLIVRGKDGRFYSEKTSEDQVQAMLKQSGITITPKSGLPAVESPERLTKSAPEAQPNSADVEFLSKHPDLDPSRNPDNSTPGPVVATEKQYPSSFPIVPVLIVGIILGGITFVLLRKTPSILEHHAAISCVKSREREFPPERHASNGHNAFND